MHLYTCTPRTCVNPGADVRGRYRSYKELAFACHRRGGGGIRNRKTCSSFSRFISAFLIGLYALRDATIRARAISFITLATTRYVFRVHIIIISRRTLRVFYVIVLIRAHVVVCLFDDQIYIY